MTREQIESWKHFLALGGTVPLDSHHWTTLDLGSGAPVVGILTIPGGRLYVIGDHPPVFVMDSSAADTFVQHLPSLLTAMGVEVPRGEVLEMVPEPAIVPEPSGNPADAWVEHIRSCDRCRDAWNARAFEGMCDGGQPLVDGYKAMLAATAYPRNGAPCPGCKGEVTRRVDPRQTTTHGEPGVWVNYRCSKGCGWGIDIVEVTDAEDSPV